MAAKIFPFGTALTILWHFAKPDGSNFNVEGYTYRLYYRTGNKETEVESPMLSSSGNTITFTIPATAPVAPGEYALRLVLFQHGSLFCRFVYNNAFVLSRRMADASIAEEQTSEGSVVNLYTVAEYYMFSPVIPTVSNNGYWVVNGETVVDGRGNPVPSSHTLTYDEETGELVIDQGRRDGSGASIEQRITSLATALESQEERYTEAEAARGNLYAAAEAERNSEYEYAESGREAAYQTAEGNMASSEAGDGSRWGEFKEAEGERTRLATEDHQQAWLDHQQAEYDHGEYESDHRRSGEDHEVAESDHRRAVEDHATATNDTSRAQEDHDRAEEDNARAALDHDQAEDDHIGAYNDRQAAASDRGLADSDRMRAESDHNTATEDHLRAEQDHTTAASDHTTAANDHTRAESDHTRAEADHTTAAADHTTAASDHTQATEDHAVMDGYDTRLGNVEGDVSQLGQELDIKASAFDLYDYKSLPSAGRVITSYNGWQSSSSKSTLVSVNPGDVFRFKRKTNSGFIALLKSDMNYASGTTVDFCAEYPGRFAVVSEEQPVTYLVMPSDCHYIYVSLDNSHGYINTEISKGGSIDSKLESIENDIDSKIESVDITVDKCNLLKAGTKLVDGIGFNSALQGIGDSLSVVYLQLVRGKSYRLNIVNPLWARTSATTTILMLRARKNDAWQTAIVLVGPTSNVANYYDFVFPECEYLQLGVRADMGEFVYFTITERPDSGPSYTATVLRNVHIAMMNKYAERYGAELSTFMAPNGTSKVCAKDIALLCLAAVENNMISSFWGKKKVNAPVFGANSRLDIYESTYTDEDSHPMVADLSAYYHIFGGKTGSGGTPSQGRNLVLAVKSKVDDSWLVGCVLYSTNDVLGDNRFSVMKQLFDMLEEHRTGATVDPSSLSCQGAYALVVPKDGNLQNYGDYPFISVGKNETGIIDSHSIVKLLTAIVATDWILPYEMLTFTSEDPYGGTSGNMYGDGDQLYAIDALTSMVLTSSSIAARCIARYVGQKVIQSNGGAEIYSFRLLNRTAYGVGSQTWLQWVASSDYQVWSAETGITLECEDSESEISISTGGTLSGVTGGSIISANTIYS